MVGGVAYAINWHFLIFKELNCILVLKDLVKNIQI
jgi:hypothetical protein